MTEKRSGIVVGFAKMWPRAVFEMKEGNKHPADVKQLLQSPGVYILYRDDKPYYVGKTTRALWLRIWAHANRPKDRYYNFWNYFSAFEVPNHRHIDEIESILIASMPTENSAVRRIHRIHMPASIAQQIHSSRVRRQA
jgi:hypothetical protein